MKGKGRRREEEGGGGGGKWNEKEEGGGGEGGRDSEILCKVVNAHFSSSPGLRGGM